MTGIIYRALNKVTGQSYVGKTIQGLEKRMQEHYYNCKSKTYKFATVLLKFNKEDWEWSVIEEVKDINKLDEREIFWIDKLNTFYNGYNSLREEYIYVDKDYLSNMLELMEEYNKASEEFRLVFSYDTMKIKYLIFDKVKRLYYLSDRLKKLDNGDYLYRKIKFKNRTSK